MLEFGKYSWEKLFDCQKIAFNKSESKLINLLTFEAALTANCTIVKWNDSFNLKT